MVGPLDGARVPASLADLVWARVGALGGAVPGVMRSASVLGTSFDPALLAELSRHPGVEVDQALWAAGHAGLLEDEATAHRVRFVHGLVARSLYDELEPAERRRLHRRAAELIERGDEHLRLSTVVQLAHHRSSAGDRADAQRWAVLAGDRSLAQLSSTEAARWYQTALEHARSLERPDQEIAELLVRLATAQRRSGQLDVAVSSVREAAALARRAGASEVIVGAALAGDRGHVAATALDAEQLDLVESALEVVRPDDVVRRARLLAQHAQELVHTDRFDDRERSAQTAIDLAERSDDPTLLAQLVSPISFGLWGLGSLGQRADLADRASRSARHSADPLVHFGSSRASYLVAIERGDGELAAASMARMRGIAGRSGDPQLVWSAESYAVFEATMAASLDEAEERLERNLELGLRIGEADALPVYGGQLFVLRSFAFRYAELAGLLDDLVTANPGVTAFALARAIACATTGRPGEAQKVLDAGIEGGLAPSRDHHALTTVVGYAVLAVELGDERAAAVLYPVLEPYGAQATFNGATSQGPVAAYLGKLASILGHHERADAHLHAALDMADRCGWRYHRATTLVALAMSCLRATGSLDDRAHRWLDEACTIAEACGLDGVRAQAATVGESAG
jgi:tetratricopeptide (TPR) repeat protein